MTWDAETRKRLEAAPRRITSFGGPFRIMAFVYEADFDAALAHIDRLEARVGFLVGVLTRLRKLLERTDISDHGLASTAYAMLRTIPARALSPSPEDKP